MDWSADDFNGERTELQLNADNVADARLDAHSGYHGRDLLTTDPNATGVRCLVPERYPNLVLV